MKVTYPNRGRCNPRSFTLIELLAVIAIAAVLATLLYYQFTVAPPLLIIPLMAL